MLEITMAYICDKKKKIVTHTTYIPNYTRIFPPFVNELNGLREERKLEVQGRTQN